jgi:cytidine deaminase
MPVNEYENCMPCQFCREPIQYQFALGDPKHTMIEPYHGGNAVPHRCQGLVDFEFQRTQQAISHDQFGAGMGND